MSQNIFTGRTEELTALNSFLKKKTASLLVVKGRRRVGKSRHCGKKTKIAEDL